MPGVTPSSTLPAAATPGLRAQRCYSPAEPGGISVVLEVKGSYPTVLRGWGVRGWGVGGGKMT